MAVASQTPSTLIPKADGLVEDRPTTEVRRAKKQTLNGLVHAPAQPVAWNRLFGSGLMPLLRTFPFFFTRDFLYNSSVNFDFDTGSDGKRPILFYELRPIRYIQVAPTDDPDASIALIRPWSGVFCVW